MNPDYKYPFHNPNHATRVSKTFFFQKFVDVNIFFGKKFCNELNIKLKVKTTNDNSFKIPV